MDAEERTPLLELLRQYLAHPTFSGDDLPVCYLRRMADIYEREGRRQVTYEDFRDLHHRLKGAGTPTRQRLAKNVYTNMSLLRGRLETASNDLGLPLIGLSRPRDPEAPYTLSIGVRLNAPSSHAELNAQGVPRMVTLVRFRGWFWYQAVTAGAVILTALAAIGAIRLILVVLSAATTRAGVGAWIAVFTVVVLSVFMTLMHITRALHGLPDRRFATLFGGRCYLRLANTELAVMRISMPCQVCAGAHQHGVMRPGWDSRRSRWVLECENNPTGHRMAFDHVTGRATPLSG